MSEPVPSSGLERRYRRLLAYYPRDHRERHGEEMVGVLMAGAADRSRPGWRESADLLWAAVRLRLRRVVAGGGIDPRDALAIVSLLGPVAILVGAARTPHDLDLVSWMTRGPVPGTPWWQQFANAPMWIVWLAVAVLGIAHRRRAAAVGAWLGTTGFVLRAFFSPAQYWWTTNWDAGWVLVGLLTAVALTWSPGPARARESVSWWANVPMATAVVAVAMLGVLAYREQLSGWRVAALAVGAVVACRPWSRAGRRAALVLLLPAMTYLLGRILLLGIDALPDYHTPSVAEVAFCCGVPVVMLLTLGGRPRRVRQQA
jgi:hypothetical protein